MEILREDDEIIIDNTNEVYIDKKTWLNSFKTFAKIMLAVVFVFFYLISALFFLAPNFDAKIFNFFGIVRAEEACYEMQYKKSGQLSDLYNLVLFEQEHSNKEKELEYITELMSDDEFLKDKGIEGFVVNPVIVNV